MAVTLSGSTTTITPTAWKWALGAVLLFPFAPISLIVSPLFLLIATGWLQRIVLDTDGITVRNWWSVRRYRWQDISDVRISKIKSSFVTAASVVNFTHETRKNTLLGKATKVLTGGTDSLPTLGMKAPQFVQLMRAYQRGAYQEEANRLSESTVPSNTPPALISAGAPELDRQKAAPTERPARQTSRRAEAGQYGRTAKRADTDMFRQRGPVKPTKKPLPRPSTPLVQDGFKLFARRPRES